MDEGTIELLPVTFQSVQFRSRLEARWAVFLEELDIDWQYEAEGFDLGDQQHYLPDFHLDVYRPDGQGGERLVGWYALDVKPKGGLWLDDVAMAHQLTRAASSGTLPQVAIVVVGPPWAPADHIAFSNGEVVSSGCPISHPYLFPCTLGFDSQDGDAFLEWTQQVQEAEKVALAARFEGSSETEAG